MVATRRTSRSAPPSDPASSRASRCGPTKSWPGVRSVSRARTSPTCIRDLHSWSRTRAPCERKTEERDAPKDFRAADMNAQETYEHGRKTHGAALAALEKRARALGTARLAVAAAIVALIGGILWGRFDAPMQTTAWTALGALIVSFVALVLVHARVHDAALGVAAALRFHERGLARLSHSWDSLPTATGPVDANHPYACDLDVFGRASLMSVVDATETRFGQEHLARLMLQEVAVGWPEEVIGRQEAARRPALG